MPWSSLKSSCFYPATSSGPWMNPWHPFPKVSVPQYSSHISSSACHPPFWATVISCLQPKANNLQILSPKFCSYSFLMSSPDNSKLDNEIWKTKLTWFTRLSQLTLCTTSLILQNCSSCLWTPATGLCVTQPHPALSCPRTLANATCMPTLLLSPFSASLESPMDISGLILNVFAQRGHLDSPVTQSIMISPPLHLCTLPQLDYILICWVHQGEKHVPDCRGISSPQHRISIKNWRMSLLNVFSKSK
jgi:hypothetical protein